MAENKLVDLNGLARYNEHIKSKISSIENTEFKAINGEPIKGTGNIETIGKLYPDSTHGEIFNEYSRNVASGDFSHAEGRGTTTNNVGEHAEGTFNLSNTGSTDSGRTIHSVGIGTGSITNRKNAHEIMCNGDHYIVGIGNYDGTNYSAAKTLQQVVNTMQGTLQTQVGTTNFSSSNYLSKETNLTDAVLQLDEEVKATNDNLDLEHANAEATYAKKTDLSGYLPLSGGTMTLTPDDIRESNHISFDIKNYDVPHIELTRKGIDEAACLIAEAGRVEVCGYLPEGPGYRHWAQLDRDGVHLYNEYYTPGSATFTRSGVTIDGKTTSDLLNAGGSTTSVSDIITQVQAAIVDSAPETLDTLNKLAAALGDDPNFATTIATQIGNKQDTLVSGTNIKTLGGESILGSGNFEVASSSDIQALFN